MRFGDPAARALVLLNSVEYSAMTPWQFCLDAKDNGYQIILIRRPGFGRSSSCETYEAQEQIVAEALDILDLQDVHLHATGSAGHLGWQVFKENDRIANATFCNYAFGPVTNFEFQRITESVRQTVKQAISNELGCKLLLTGLRALEKSGKKADYIESFFGKSEADLEFVKQHQTDLYGTFKALAQLSAKTLRNDIRQLTVLAEPDPSFQSTKPFELLLGADAPEPFRNIASERAKALGGEVITTDRHDFFVGLIDFFDREKFA